MKGRGFVPYLLVMPAVILIAGMIVSLAVLVQSSFLSSPNADATLTLFQYERLLTTPQYLGHFGRSAWYALLATVVAVLLGYPVAYYMEITGPRLRRYILMFLVVVFFSDYVLRMFGLILVFGRNGLVNTLLVWSGLTDEPLRLMFNEFGVIVGLVTGGLPFMIFALNGVIARVDPRLRDAAASLGASPARTFVRVTLPLTVPGILSGSIIVFLLSLNSFITPALLGGGFIEMVATFIYEQAIELFNLPLGAAAAVLVFVVAMILLLGLNRLVEARGRRFGIR